VQPDDLRVAVLSDCLQPDDLRVAVLSDCLQPDDLRVAVLSDCLQPDVLGLAVLSEDCGLRLRGPTGRKLCQELADEPVSIDHRRDVLGFAQGFVHPLMRRIGCRGPLTTGTPLLNDVGEFVEGAPDGRPVRLDQLGEVHPVAREPVEDLA